MFFSQLLQCVFKALKGEFLVIFNLEWTCGFGFKSKFFKFTILFSTFMRFSLHREALKQSAVDPSTGRVDINILAAGISATTRQIIDQLAEAIRSELSQRQGTLISLKQLMQRLRQNDLVNFRNFA